MKAQLKTTILFSLVLPILFSGCRTVQEVSSEERYIESTLLGKWKLQRIGHYKYGWGAKDSEGSKPEIRYDCATFSGDSTSIAAKSKFQKCPHYLSLYRGIPLLKYPNLLMGMGNMTPWKWEVRLRENDFPQLSIEYRPDSVENWTIEELTDYSLIISRESPEEDCSSCIKSGVSICYQRLFSR